jgi:uncharacterized protein (UPF0332 family)
MKPADLIAQARQLANASPKKPRDADLRRAVSAAYYALFHAVARAGADLVVGTISANRSNKAWRQVYRALQHGEAKTRCESLPNAFPQGLQDVADALVALQKLRHDADYDPTASFTRKDVQNHILQAETAVVKLKGASVPDRRAFVVWLLFHNRK